MAKRREHRLWTSGLAVVLLAVAGPLAAQDVPATNTTATPAPAQSSADDSLIGPPQLRDFSLDGTVTRRAEPVATPTPTPAPRTTAPATGTSGSADRTAPARATPSATADRAPATAAAPDRGGSSSAVPPDLPPPTPAEPFDITAGFNDAPLPTTARPVAPPVEDGLPWAWMLALAAALGGGFMLWRKRRADAGRYAFAGVSELAAPEPAPAPPPMPRAQPAPPRATTAPPPRTPAAPPPSAPKPATASDGGIVATGLRPKLGFELRPIRAETDDKRGAALLFDVIVINNGHAPARDVLVEAQLVNAGPKQDEQIGRFFREPVGKGERLPVIPPLGRISLKTRLSIPGDEMNPIEVDGRQLFVPLVAFNALYRWSGGEEQDSASFLVGRGNQQSAKMAPFRLDQGARSWTGLDARPHSLGLQA